MIVALSEVYTCELEGSVALQYTSPDVVSEYTRTSLLSDKLDIRILSSKLQDGWS